MYTKLLFKVFVVIVFLTVLKFCCSKEAYFVGSSNRPNSKDLIKDSLPIKIKVNNNITVENYFDYLDALVKKYDPFTPYNLTEHLLVRHNSWLIDTLENTDYYRMKARDSFVYDQKKLIIIHKGSSIVIPDSIVASKILSTFKKTTIDINIPEFKLRIYEDSIKRYEFPIRVGRHEKKYLEMSGRIQDLRTKTGEGYIINHVRNPRYVNPVNNYEYLVTKRDDGKITKLPQIPFIETELHGLRYGQLIHPTTNPMTLGKAYSNGCIGTKEADAWVIYYFAPIHTKIKIRYDLNIINDNGKKIGLKDVYNYNK